MSRGSRNRSLAISDLDRLLENLQSIEKCNQEVLDLVRTVLYKSDPNASLPNFNGAVSFRSNKISKSNVAVAVAVDHKDSNPAVVLQSAMRIVQVCLKTLSSVENLNRSDESSAKAAGTSPRASKVFTTNLDKLVSVCISALDTWNSLKDLLNRPLIELEVSQHNLITKLIDLGCETHILQEMNKLHTRLTISLSLPGIETKPFPANLVLYGWLADLKESQVRLIVASLLNVLRYFASSSTIVDESALSQVGLDHGPLWWCVHQRTLMCKSVDKNLDYLKSCFYKIAQKSNLSDRFPLYILAVRSCLHKTTIDWDVSLNIFLQALEVATPENDQYQEVKGFADLLLSSIEEKSKLILAKKMELYASRLNHSEEMERWQSTLSQSMSQIEKILSMLGDACKCLQASTKEKTQDQLIQLATYMAEVKCPELSVEESQRLLKRVEVLWRRVDSIATRSRELMFAARGVLDVMLNFIMSCQEVCLLSASWLPTFIHRSIDMFGVREKKIDQSHIDVSFQRLSKLQKISQIMKLKDVDIAFYNFGGTLYIQRYYGWASRFFMQSIQACSVDYKRMGWVCTSLLADKNYDQALYWIRQSFTAMEKSQVLADLDRASSLYSIHDIANQFPEVHQQIVNLASIFADQPERVDISVLPTMHPLALAIMLEWLYQSSMHRNTLKTLPPNGIQIVLRTYERLQYPVRYYRAICLLMRFASASHQDSLARSTILEVDLQEALAQEKCRDKALLPEQPVYEAQLFVYRALFSDLARLQENVETALRNVSTLLSSKLYQKTSAADMQGLGMVLLSLERRLEQEDMHLERINLLELCCNLAPSSASYVLLAETYLHVGLSAKVPTILAKATTELGEEPDIYSRAAVVIVQADYHIIVNEHDRALNALELLKGEFECVAESSSSLLILARVLELYARCCKERGILAEAIRLSLEAIQVWKRIMARQARKLATTKSLEVDLVNSMQQLELANEENPFRIFCSTNLMICQAELANQYEKSGILREAEFYYLQALSMAKSVASSTKVVRSTCLYVRFLLNCGRIDDASTRWQEADAQKAEVKLPLDETLVLLTEAEILRSQGYNEDATQKLQAGTLRIQQFYAQAAVSGATTSTTKRAPRKKDAKILIRSIPLDKRMAELVFAQLEGHMHDQTGVELIKAQIGEMCGTNEIDRMINYNTALMQLAQAENLMSADPVYGVLPESALSLPSICGKSLKSPKNATLKDRKKGSGAGKRTRDASREIQLLLETSKNSLVVVMETSLLEGQSHEPYKHSSLFTSLNLMHSALLLPREHANISSAASTFFLESSRGVSLWREYERKHITPRQGREIQWPNLKEIVGSTLPSKDGYQSNFVDNIPLGWNVVSIGLSLTQNDLIISRIQAQRAPLILKLPLSRHKSRDADEETFEFTDAMDELRAIISESDATARNAKNITEKSAKSEWWQSRRDLDERLKTLLENIERCWLGGFKGMLNGSYHDDSALQFFRQTFAKILLKHVPSKNTRPFDLDARLLDLFIDLGQIKTDDSLESLEDLLYFVLDIFQFHGESVAYDEIDLDLMTVDIQDALNIYHDRKASSVLNQHTVLILDKSVHAIPWESLSCLRGLSVSRIPSLPVLHELLKLYDYSLPISVDRKRGTYVLNPSGDLIGTESTFEKTLSSLEDWYGIIHRKPEEPELVKALSQSSIYLYFGHGAGDQFIHASKIKQLSNCAVSILMGCSSGALKDQGIFDPWGTVHNYLIARSPCIVANLWDVTDKDIDKFSKSMLEKWSLFQSEHPQSRTAVNLCQAVADSREECLLTYLNGSAPIVYGLPIYLRQ